MRYDFFKPVRNSNIVMAGGPPKTEQLRAIYEKKYWTIINNGLLKKSKKLFQNDDDLMQEVNAIKAAIQTYGPQSDQIAEIRVNTNPKTRGIC
jgi:hypothetical protein